MEKTSKYLLLFMAASFIGWLYEIACMELLFGVYADRGVLHLPLCPIYGFGLLILIAIFGRVRSSILLFAGSVLLTSGIELSVSYFMEYVFHTALWTYEGWPLSFQNRISLVSSCIFGLMALLNIKLIKPAVEKLYDSRYKKAVMISTCLIFIFCVIWELYFVWPAVTGAAKSEGTDTSAEIIAEEEGNITPVEDVQPSPTVTPTPSPAPTPIPTPTPFPEPKIPDISQRGMTEDVPDAYLLPAKIQGSVESISYNSLDFAGSNEMIVKNANVYLPASYDPEDDEARYDIFYMMHGFGGDAEEFFSNNDGMEKNLIDNMIMNGDIPPIIVVAATYDAGNGRRDYDRSEEEVRAFHRDFEEYLMPAVEGQYHSYALSSSREDLMASRDHRAFGGFSMGAVTTWFEFCYNSDYIRYFMPISAACWYYGDIHDAEPVLNTDYLISVVNEKKLDERGYFIYACTGTKDSMRGELDLLMHEMFSREDIFDAEHAVYYYSEGAAHELVALPEYIYNGLKVFFGKGGNSENKAE